MRNRGISIREISHKKMGYEKQEINFLHFGPIFGLFQIRNIVNPKFPVQLSPFYRVGFFSVFSRFS